MIHETDLINRGLRLIGSRSITSLDQNDEIAADARLYWSDALEAFLEERMWSFATREEKLTLLSRDDFNILGEAIENVHGVNWKYIHGLPEDFLKLRKILGHGDPRFSIRVYKSRLALYTNLEQVTILYISKMIPLDLMSAAAREALVVRFAIFMDAARNGGSNSQNLTTKYEQLLSQAIRQEPASESRRHLDRGLLNKVRHGIQPAAYCAQDELREWGSGTGNLEPD